MKRIIRFLKRLYWLYVATPIDYAKHLGVTIGEHTHITSKNWPSEAYLIKIGSHCQITDNVSMYTHGGANVLRKDIPDFDCFGKIIIEDWCYIGAYSIILPGVTIGEGSLVAAGSVVTKSVPPHSVVGGNPAKILCTIEDFKVKNIQYNTHTFGLGYTEKKSILTNLKSDQFVTK